MDNLKIIFTRTLRLLIKLKPNVLKHVKYSIIILLIAFSFTAKSQYIQFSQYYATPTVLAPSFTGAVEKSRVNFNYRDQWGKIANSIFVTYAAGYDIHVQNVNSGFGVLLIKDQAGAGNLSRTEIGASYSWYTQLDRNKKIFFRPGVQFKLSQRSIDFYALTFGDQIGSDGTIAPQSIQPYPADVKKTSVDAASSILFYSPDFWAGITVDHLFRPTDAFYDPTYRVPIKYSVFGGYKFKLGGSSYGHRSASSIQDWFFVSAYYRLQSVSSQMDIGGYWSHEPFTLGIWLRGLPYLNIERTVNIDAVIFLVSYKIFNFQIGYSYDFTVSPLLSKTGGSHEISVSYKFNTRLKSKPRYGPLPCPNL